jgi:hypothetical protein
MYIRRVLFAVAACAATSFALATMTAETAGAAQLAPTSSRARAHKAPKAKVYEACDPVVGCEPSSDPPFLIYSKTKTWEFEGFGGTGYSGTFEKSGKYTIFHYSEGNDCVLRLKKVKKNYVGHAEVCSEEEFELLYRS